MSATCQKYRKSGSQQGGHAVLVPHAAQKQCQGFGPKVSGTGLVKGGWTAASYLLAQMPQLHQPLQPGSSRLSHILPAPHKACKAAWQPSSAAALVLPGPVPSARCMNGHHQRCTTTKRHRTGLRVWQTSHDQLPAIEDAVLLCANTASLLWYWTSGGSPGGSCCSMRCTWCSICPCAPCNLSPHLTHQACGRPWAGSELRREAEQTPPVYSRGSLGMLTCLYQASTHGGRLCMQARPPPPSAHGPTVCPQLYPAHVRMLAAGSAYQLARGIGSCSLL